MVTASTGLEEGDDEGAVAGLNLLSPLYNLPPSVRCFFFFNLLCFLEKKQRNEKSVYFLLFPLSVRPFFLPPPSLPVLLLWFL